MFNLIILLATLSPLMLCQLLGWGKSPEALYSSEDGEEFDWQNLMGTWYMIQADRVSIRRFKECNQYRLVQAQGEYPKTLDMYSNRPKDQEVLIYDFLESIINCPMSEESPHKCNYTMKRLVKQAWMYLNANVISFTKERNLTIFINRDFGKIFHIKFCHIYSRNKFLDPVLLEEERQKCSMLGQRLRRLETIDHSDETCLNRYMD